MKRISWRSLTLAASLGLGLAGCDGGGDLDKAVPKDQPYAAPAGAPGGPSIKADPFAIGNKPTKPAAAGDAAKAPAGDPAKPAEPAEPAK
jgi:hypothetical protein